MTATLLSAGQAGSYRLQPRCACRPACLTAIRRDDDVTRTVAGTSLTAHVAVVAHLAAVDVEDVEAAS